MLLGLQGCCFSVKDTAGQLRCFFWKAFLGDWNTGIVICLCQDAHPGLVSITVMASRGDDVVVQCDVAKASWDDRTGCMHMYLGT